MKLKHYILIATAALVVLSVTGCSESHHQAAAERRWDRVMAQARIDAANESIEQGRLAYARALLQEISESDSAFSDEAAEALDRLRLVTEQFAQIRGMDGMSELN